MSNTNEGNLEFYFKEMLNKTAREAQIDETYQKDFQDLTLKVNWKICGLKGYQSYEQTQCSFEDGILRKDADVTLVIQNRSLASKILQGEYFDTTMGRDSENNFMINHTKGWEINDTPNGPQRQRVNELFLTALFKNPDVSPLILTKLPIFHALEKKRNQTKDGEEYGAYLPVNQSLGTYQNHILPVKVFEHFINKASQIVVYYWTCRKHFDFQNHSHELWCMYMGDDTVNMVIPSDRGHIATKEEALERVKVAINDGLIPLLGRAMGETEEFGIEDTGHFLSSCFCCSCCCFNGKVITNGTATSGSIFQRIKGLEVKIDGSKCIGCGACLEVCVFKGRKLLDGKAEINSEYCLGCGRCVDVCPKGATSIEIEDPRFIDELITKIESVVDVESQQA